MKKYLITGLLLVTEIAFSKAPKENHFFKNGLNTPVFGEIYAGKPGEGEHTAYGVKFGAQVARYSDYFSLTGGFVGTGGDKGTSPRSFGPSLEAIIMPGFFIHGSLAYTMASGSVGGYTYDDTENGETTTRIDYKSNDISINLLWTFKDEMQLSLGYIFGTPTLETDAASKSNEIVFDNNGDRDDAKDVLATSGVITFGIRGTGL